MCRLVHYKDGQYVAEIKLKHIRNVSSQAEKCKNISRIMLFGSSIEERCTDRSDIDIAVFGRMLKAKYLGSGEFILVPVNSGDFRISCFCMTWTRIMIYCISAKGRIIRIRSWQISIAEPRYTGEAKHYDIDKRTHKSRYHRIWAGYRILSGT